MRNEWKWHPHMMKMFLVFFQSWGFYIESSVFTSMEIHLPGCVNCSSQGEWLICFQQIGPWTTAGLLSLFQGPWDSSLLKQIVASWYLENPKAAGLWRIRRLKMYSKPHRLSSASRCLPLCGNYTWTCQRCTLVRTQRIGPGVTKGCIQQDAVCHFVRHSMAFESLTSKRTLCKSLTLKNTTRWPLSTWGFGGNIKTAG